MAPDRPAPMASPTSAAVMIELCSATHVMLMLRAQKPFENLSLYWRKRHTSALAKVR